MADTQVERMEAVKRAYAEIILNTAAESAARILASERKALALHRTLASSKQDAVDIMLRLKSLMDAKIHEAETRNTLHARRIQELESQLHDAQTLILSLQADLERVTALLSYNTNATPAAPAPAPAPSPSPSPPSPPPLPLPLQEDEENTSTSYQNVLSTDNSSCSLKDLLPSASASSVATHRASKVRSRNRCTQRVRAFLQSKDLKGTI